MTNKYLEKIAKAISSDEKKSRSAAWGTMGRTMLGGAIGGPIGAGFGYRTGIEKHAPNVKREDRTGQAVRGYARQQVRGTAEGVAGGAAGAAAAGGAVHLLAKARKIVPTKAREAVHGAALVGGMAGALGGAIHGTYKSTKNKLDELTGRKKK